MKKKASPMAIPVMVISSLGPYLSVILPAIMANTPPKSNASETASDRLPLSSSRASAIYLRKTLNVELIEPKIVVNMTEAATITQP
jgi:hypothetical protein